MYLKEERENAAVTKQGVEAEGRMCILIEGDVRKQNFCEKAVARAARELDGRGGGCGKRDWNPL